MWCKKFKVIGLIAQNKGDRSKVKVITSYYVKISQRLRQCFMRFVLGQALITIPEDMSKDTVNRSYHVQIGQVA